MADHRVAGGRSQSTSLIGIGAQMRERRARISRTLIDAELDRRRGVSARCGCRRVERDDLDWPRAVAADRATASPSSCRRCGTAAGSRSRKVRALHFGADDRENHVAFGKAVCWRRSSFISSVPAPRRRSSRAGIEAGARCGGCAGACCLFTRESRQNCAVNVAQDQHYRSSWHRRLNRRGFERSFAMAVSAGAPVRLRAVAFTALSHSGR